MTVKAVILVGGDTTGTRFRPLTMDMPKVLFPIAGKPLVSHIIDHLVDQLQSEIEEVLLVSFFKDCLVFLEYIASVRVAYPLLKVTYLEEPYPLGTGGGLYYFRDKICHKDDSKILLIHGDVVCDYPFKQLIEFSKKSNSDAVLLGIDPRLLVNDHQTLPGYSASTGIYDKDQIFKDYGTIVSNDSKIVHYVEKPKSDSFAKFEDLAYSISLNGGVYVFSNKIFLLLEKAQEVKALRVVKEKDLDDEDTYDNILSLELDVFKELPADENVGFSCFKYPGLWYQVKTPIFALLANNFFLKQEHESNSLDITGPVKVLNSDLSYSKGYKIGPNVSIGNNVTIGNGVRLKNCIISDDVTIEDHSIVSNAIVSKGVKIGKWCRIEGTIGAPATNKSITLFVSENYLKLVNNIVVLCRDTVVGNQVFVYNSVVLPHKELKEDVKYEIVM